MIKKIEIKNFNNLSSVEFTPDFLNVLVGKTGAGKSSVLDAIIRGMTGSIDPEQVKEGEKRASVAITFDDGTTIERRRTGKTQKCYISGNANSMKATNAFVEDRIGVPLKAVESMEGVQFFTGKSSKEIGSLLYKILPLSLTFDKVVELAEGVMGVFTQEERDTLRGAFEDPSSIGDSDLVKARKVLFEERTDVNADVRRLRALASQISQCPQESPDTLKKRLEEIAGLEEKAKAHDALVKAYQNAVATRARILAQLQNIEAQLAAMEAVKEPDAERETLVNKSLAELRDKLVRGRSVVAQCDTIIADDTTKLVGLESGVCPLNVSIRCTTDKTRIIHSAKEHLQKAKGRREATSSSIPNIEKSIGELERELTSLAQQKADWARKKVLLDQKASFVVPEEPEKPQDVPVADFASEKAEIYAKMRAFSVAEEVAKSQKELLVKSDRAAVLDKLIAALDEKGGIRMAILSAALAPFQSLCAKKADRFRKGFGVKFVCDDGLDIQIETHPGNGFRSINTASTGEFLFVSYMLMSVISQVSNPGFMILDGLDALDAETLASLLAVVKADHAVEHVFCATVNHSDTLEALKKIGANIIAI